MVGGVRQMKKRRVRNPLFRRIPRELIGDWRKYLVVSLFLILVIGFVSGMYVANESMMTAAEESVTKYCLEDGHFELKEKADDELLSAIATGERADIPYELDSTDFHPVPVKVYENVYRSESEDNNCDGNADGSVRVFVKTETMNQACLMDGHFPESEDEIAIDRMHADNAGVSVGDEIAVGSKRFRVVGLIAYVNYSTLYEKNSGNSSAFRLNQIKK